MTTALTKMIPCVSKTLEVACPAFNTLVLSFGIVRLDNDNLKASHFDPDRSIMQNTSNPAMLKMHFDLKQEEDGWPPVAGESVWVTRLHGNIFQVENVPFFAKRIAFNDHVEGHSHENVIYFRRHVKSSGYTTVRVIFHLLGKQDDLVHRLEALGCEIEGAPQFKLLAIGIPQGDDFERAMDAIREGYREKWWDYEESCFPAKPKRAWWRVF